MSDHIRHDHVCPHCRAELDCVSAADGGDSAPFPGAFSMCFDCGEWSVYDDELSLRLPTRDEEWELLSNTEAQLAKEAWLIMKASTS